ncbi:MAG TPA: type IV toxin-antitoxin system AbiEi family antitoxin domain-containing protein, partial [Actinomycetota bacterium]|nr:type IV toxin-antitoxin system AbiEi family antitoxin domain-containing protein [Actinomycetota bacterium]
MATEKQRKAKELAGIARRQHGIVTRAQARALGVSVSAMARAVERGEWQRVHPGIFRIDRGADALTSLMVAAVLRAPGRTWVSHRSAALLSGMEIQARALWPDVTTTANLRGGRATVHSVASMPEEDATSRRGIPVTSAARTLVD